MSIKIHWVRSTTNQKERVQRLARASVDEFFKHAGLTEIRLSPFKMCRGINGLELIRLAPGQDDTVQHVGCVSVRIHLEGTLGLFCYLWVPKEKPERIEELIKGGPYNRKPRRDAEQARA